jgi:hypothetical protein
MSGILIVIGLIIFFFLLPAKWDPAIWLKTQTERRAGRWDPKGLVDNRHWLVILWLILTEK